MQRGLKSVLSFRCRFNRGEVKLQFLDGNEGNAFCIAGSQVLLSKGHLKMSAQPNQLKMFH